MLGLRRGSPMSIVVNAAEPTAQRVPQYHSKLMANGRLKSYTCSIDWQAILIPSVAHQLSIQD